MLRAAALAAALASAGCNAIFGIEAGKPDEAGLVHVDPRGQQFAYTETVFQIHGGSSKQYKVEASLDHAFAIDAKEVTVGRFKKWVAASLKHPDSGAVLDPGGPYAASMVWLQDWDDATGIAGGGYKMASCPTDAPYDKFENPTFLFKENDALPMNCVNWAEALAFCVFEGKRLPTDVEWQYVVQGGTHDDARPFSGSISCSDVTYNDATNPFCGFPVAVGTATGTSRDGLFDLGGSLREWVWDVDGPLDPKGAPSKAAKAGRRIIRGTAYLSSAQKIDSERDLSSAGDFGDFAGDVGFRCARTLQAVEE